MLAANEALVARKAASVQLHASLSDVKPDVEARHDGVVKARSGGMSASDWWASCNS